MIIHADKFVNHVKYRIAKNLTKYLNYIMENNLTLQCKQNLLEQIYLPKENGSYKTFDNARPITKTSPIYKLLDTIINLKLN